MVRAASSRWPCHLYQRAASCLLLVLMQKKLQNNCKIKDLEQI
jgi:hypothetical protein